MQDLEVTCEWVAKDWHVWPSTSYNSQMENPPEGYNMQNILMFPSLAFLFPSHIVTTLPEKHYAKDRKSKGIS